VSHLKCRLPFLHLHLHPSLNPGVDCRDPPTFPAGKLLPRFLCRFRFSFLLSVVLIDQDRLVWMLDLFFMLMFCFNVVSIFHAFIFYSVLFYCKVTLGDLKGRLQMKCIIIIIFRSPEHFDLWPNTCQKHSHQQLCVFCCCCELCLFSKAEYTVIYCTSFHFLPPNTEQIALL